MRHCRRWTASPASLCARQRRKNPLPRLSRPTSASMPGFPRAGASPQFPARRGPDSWRAWAPAALRTDTSSYTAAFRPIPRSRANSSTLSHLFIRSTACCLNSRLCRLHLPMYASFLRIRSPVRCKVRSLVVSQLWGSVHGWTEPTSHLTYLLMLTSGWGRLSACGRFSSGLFRLRQSPVRGRTRPAPAAQFQFGALEIQLQPKLNLPPCSRAV